MHHVFISRGIPNYNYKRGKISFIRAQRVQNGEVSIAQHSYIANLLAIPSLFFVSHNIPQINHSNLFH